MPVSTVRVRGKNFPTETECKNNPLSPRHWGIKVLQLYSIRTSSCSKKWSPFIRNCVTRGVGTRCYRFVLQGTEFLSRLVTFPNRRTPLRKETVNMNRKKKPSSGQTSVSISWLGFLRRLALHICKYSCIHRAPAAVVSSGEAYFPEWQANGYITTEGRQKSTTVWHGPIAERQSRRIQRIQGITV